MVFEKIFISPVESGTGYISVPFPGDSAPESGVRRSCPAYPVDFCRTKDAPSSVTACAVTPSPQWEGVGEHVKTAPACGRGGP